MNWVLNWVNTILRIVVYLSLFAVAVFTLAVFTNIGYGKPEAALERLGMVPVWFGVFAGAGAALKVLELLERIAVAVEKQ